MYSQANILSFADKIRDHDWTNVYSQSDPQTAYTCFFDDYRHMYNDSFPSKTLTQGYKTRKPWLTEGMKESIKKRIKCIEHISKQRIENKN